MKYFLINLLLITSLFAQNDRYINVGSWGTGQTISNSIENPGNIGFFPFSYIETGLITYPLDRRIEFANGMFRYNSFGFGLGILHHQIGNIEGRSSNTVEPDYLFDYSQTSFMGSVSYRKNSFSAGITGNYRSDNLVDNDNQTYFDIGISTIPFNRIRVGMIVYNILNKQKSLRVSGLYDTGYFNLLADIENDLTKDYRNRFHIGAESKLLFNMIYLRGGYDHDQVVGGFGIEINNSPITINYARSVDKITERSVHFVSLTLSKSKRKLKKSPIMDDTELVEELLEDIEKDIATNFSLVNYARIVNTSHLNVREKHSPTSKIVKVIQLNELYEIVDTWGGWIKIKIDDNLFGWIFSKYAEKIIK